MTGPDSPGETGAGDLLNHANRVQTLSLGSRVAFPIQTNEKLNGPVTVVQGGQKVPHAVVLELKTRSQIVERLFDIEQKLVDLWISQTPNFVEAYHRSVGYRTHNQLSLQQGKFEDIKVNSIGDQLAKWETANAIALESLRRYWARLFRRSKRHRVLAW